MDCLEVCRFGRNDCLKAPYQRKTYRSLKWSPHHPASLVRHCSGARQKKAFALLQHHLETHTVDLNKLLVIALLFRAPRDVFLFLLHKHLEASTTMDTTVFHAMLLYGNEDDCRYLSSVLDTAQARDFLERMLLHAAYHHLRPFVEFLMKLGATGDHVFVSVDRNVEKMELPIQSFFLKTEDLYHPAADSVLRWRLWKRVDIDWGMVCLFTAPSWEKVTSKLFNALCQSNTRPTPAQLAQLVQLAPNLVKDYSTASYMVDALRNSYFELAWLLFCSKPPEAPVLLPKCVSMLEQTSSSKSWPDIVAATSLFLKAVVKQQPDTYRLTKDNMTPICRRLYDMPFSSVDQFLSLLRPLVAAGLNLYHTVPTFNGSTLLVHAIQHKKEIIACGVLQMPIHMEIKGADTLLLMAEGLLELALQHGAYYAAPLGSGVIHKTQALHIVILLMRYNYRILTASEHKELLLQFPGACDVLALLQKENLLRVEYMKIFHRTVLRELVQVRPAFKFANYELYRLLLDLKHKQADVSDPAVAAVLQKHFGHSQLTLVDVDNWIRQ